MSRDSLFLLTWTAPGDDGDEGQASAYDIRHSLRPSTEADWWDSAAAPLPDVPPPAVAGTGESLLVCLGSPDSTHFLALKAVDEAGNESAMSNVASFSSTADTDTIPPARIQDLRARPTSSQSVLLVWTAVGDDGGKGRAANYDIRSSISADSLRAWDLVAARLGQELAPRQAGSAESLLIESLVPNTEYYFAIKVRDEESNWSAQSNIAKGVTLPPGGRFLYVTADGSGDFARIQDAIDAAVHGDVVELGDGTYAGQGNRALRYKGKSITVRSRSGNAASCIIDCGRAGRGVEFVDGEDCRAVLDGVTITHGTAPDHGGAILSIYKIGTQSGPTITNCTFTDNTAPNGAAIYVSSHEISIENSRFYSNTGIAGALCVEGELALIRGCYFSDNVTPFGGAIFCFDSELALLECQFERNGASGGPFPELASGGAISCWYSTLALEQCYFLENETEGLGGALFLSDSSQVMLSRCTLRANSAIQGGGAIALSLFELSGGRFLAEECTFLGNESDGPGGAIHCFGSSPRFTGCTMALNRSTQGGGIVFCEGGSSPLMSSCILAFNDSGGTVVCEEAACEPVLACSDVFGNGGGDWGGCIDGLLGLDGNISLDPRFCGLANGDIRLRADSPCTAMNSPCGLMGISGATCPSR